MFSLLPTEYFLRDVSFLPKPAKQKMKHLFSLLEQNPFHPMLHAKPFHGALAGLFSFRVGRDYRVIMQINHERAEIILLRAKNRKEIYR